MKTKRNVFDHGVSTKRAFESLTTILIEASASHAKNARVISGKRKPSSKLFFNAVDQGKRCNHPEFPAFMIGTRSIWQARQELMVA